jgi:ubiquinone/menaquinone biosynthesis C-methylase UbiE
MTQAMDPNRLFSDPALADFYDIESSFAAEDEPCRALAATASSVLDLGCGTGRLAAGSL